MSDQKENQKPDYVINSDKSVTITSGKFKDVRIVFSNFEVVYDKIQNCNLISYDYNIMEGVVEINEGDEIKSLMRSIIDDTIERYQNKEE